MKVREFRTEDISEIDKIFRAQPDLGIPSLKNVVDQAVVEDDDGRIIAYGVIKLYAEGVLIVDQTIMKRSKAWIVMSLLRRALGIVNDRCIEQLFVVSNTEGYSTVLKKKFGFKEASGKTLFKELSNG